jgi:hypothetical protein
MRSRLFLSRDRILHTFLISLRDKGANGRDRLTGYHPASVEEEQTGLEALPLGRSAIGTAGFEPATP